MSEVRMILAAVERGDAHAAEELLPLVYEELRKPATQRLAGEKPGQTLQATALVHEAYVRLVGDAAAHWDGRSHFFAAAAEAMRRICIDRARHKATEKAGGGRAGWTWTTSIRHSTNPTLNSSRSTSHFGNWSRDTRGRLRSSSSGFSPG
jgi:RNA polymerase sigma factor (TIGR02999 family)